MFKFNECLKIAREKAGLTQKELAERLNVPPPVISRYETSDIEPRIGFVVDVATVLGITLDELIPINTSKIDLYNKLLSGLFYVHEDIKFYELTDIRGTNTDNKLFSVRFYNKAEFEKKLDDIILKSQQESQQTLKIHLILHIMRFMINSENKQLSDAVKKIPSHNTHNEE